MNQHKNKNDFQSFILEEQNSNLVQLHALLDLYEVITKFDIFIYLLFSVC